MYENYCEYDDETNLILNCIDYIKGEILDAIMKTVILESQKPNLVQNNPAITKSQNTPCDCRT